MGGEPITGPSPGTFATIADDDDDTEGCLCLVVGYASRRGLISRVTAAAARQVRLSPALGDFLHLRYVDLGPQPGPDGDPSGPARRIAADLMTVKETAGRSYFALIVIAKEATTIEGLLSSCAVEPFLAALRMRYTGIASLDDRQESDCATDIITAPDGSWRGERELIDALHQRCEDLPRDFAARGDAGMTRAEVTALRQARSRSVLQEAQAEPAADGDAPVGTLAAASADEVPVPDVLGDAPAATGAAASPAAPPAAGDTTAPAGPAGPAARTLAALSPARLLAGIPLRRGKPAAGAADAERVPEHPPRTAIGLAYLLMILDQDAVADPAISRLQAAVLAVARRIAEQTGSEYRVRMVHGNDKLIRSDPRTLGRILRRPVKRSVRTEDFTAVLKVVRSSLRHDSELVQSQAAAYGLGVAPPVIVIFAADPPMAEPGAAAVFADIAAKARVVWVVPRKLEGLVSAAFSRGDAVTVLGEHQAVADDILDLMGAGASRPEPDDGPGITPDTAG